MFIHLDKKLEETAIHHTQISKIASDFWLAELAYVIWRLGGFITVNRLRDMSVGELANICERNGLAMISKKSCMPISVYHELLTHGLEGAPQCHE